MEFYLQVAGGFLYVMLGMRVKVGLFVKRIVVFLVRPLTDSVCSY